MIGIWGLVNAIGIVKLQIPYEDLDVKIVVDFIVLLEPIPTLISVQDMLRKNLDISVLKCHVTCGRFKQILEMKTLFMIHRWTRADMNYV